MPRLDYLSFDIPVLLFTFGVSILAGISLAVSPALHIYRTEYMESSKRGTALSSSRLRIRRGNPVGRTVSSLGSAPWEIVGVVDDVRQQGLMSRSEPQFFLEYRQMQHANPGWNTGLDRLYSSHMYFAMRATGKPSALVPSIRQMIGQLDKTADMNNTLALGNVVSNWSCPQN